MKFSKKCWTIHLYANNVIKNKAKFSLQDHQQGEENEKYQNECDTP